MISSTPYTDKTVSIGASAQPADDNTGPPEAVSAVTIEIMKNELKRVEEYVNIQDNATVIELPKFEFTEAFTTEVSKYDKTKKKKKTKKTPYDKPKEYKNGMSNFVAFTSHFLPYFEGTTSKPFRNILWDVYKGAINTWFDNHSLSKEKAKELGRKKYIAHLRSVAPEFKSAFPNVVSKLQLFDASLTGDEHRSKVLQQHSHEQAHSHTPCIGAMNASAPTHLC
jgi:hypothetical protein